MSRLLSWGARLPPQLRRRLARLPGVGALRRHLLGGPAAQGPGPGELRAVVYLPTWASWDTMVQRPQYLVRAFAAAGHPTYFVDPRAAEAYRDNGVNVVPDLTHCPASGVILYVHFAPLRELFDRFENPAVIYDILDDLVIYEPDEVDKPPGSRVRDHHPQLVTSADVVTASAPELVDRHHSERRDMLLVKNGVDPDLFGRPAPRPADLPPPGSKRPLVGYHGAIAPWLDFGLIAGVAEARRDWDFVLVGPVHPASTRQAAQLEGMPNVSLLGERPSDLMPAYAQAFDVGAVWFAIDHLTMAVTPLKLYEYLASGTPIVSSPLPAATAEPLVHTADGIPAFVAALEEALAQRLDPAFVPAAKAAAARYSWDARLAPVLGVLDELGLRRVPQ